MPKLTPTQQRVRRHHRVRRRVTGTPERPRLAVYRSMQHIYAQVIDDTARRTLVAASTLEPALKEALAGKTKKAQARGVRVAKSLGLPSGSIEINPRGQTVADVIVILGRDFKP